MVRIVVRKYHLEKIQPVTEYQKYGHKSYGSIVALGARLHVDQQGSQEVDDQVQVENTLVSSFKPGLKVNSLFRNIGIPDQHELGKPQVSPEDGKGELELSQIM